MYVGRAGYQRRQVLGEDLRARVDLHPYLRVGAVLNLRTTTSQKCEAVPRRARI